MARDANKRGWWQTYSGVVLLPYADYITLETDADQRAPEEVTALAEVRQARQSVLSRPDEPLDVWAIIHEAALRQRFAIRPGIMREQLRRLLDVSELPNVTVQVMASDSTVRPGNAGGFSPVSFPSPIPDVVLLENLTGATYVEGDGETAPFTKGFECIRTAALSVEDSLALIATLEEGHRK